MTGASRGIGRVVAAELARSGRRVLCTARSSDGLAVTADAIRSNGGDVVTVPCDLRDEAAVAALAEVAASELGAIDVLVNNAGINRVRPIADMSLGDWNDVLATNLTATFLVTRACLDLVAARRGVIVNVASVGGLPGVEKFPGFGAYSASKYGVIGFTEVLAIEARERGVRAHAICPGSTATEVLADTLPDAPRALDPVEVARTVLWLAGEAPLASTGSTITLWP